MIKALDSASACKVKKGDASGRSKAAKEALKAILGAE